LCSHIASVFGSLKFNLERLLFTPRLAYSPALLVVPNLPQTEIIVRPFIAILSVVVLSMSACKAKKGDTGEQGARGPAGISGPSGQVPIAILSGSVTSDDFNVLDSRITSAAAFIVYGSAGGELIQMPIFNTAGGFNVLYVASVGKIRILNASSGGFTGYVIVLVE
jgi:hypothetical protein